MLSCRLSKISLDIFIKHVALKLLMNPTCTTSNINSILLLITCGQLVQKQKETSNVYTFVNVISRGIFNSLYDI